MRIATHCHGLLSLRTMSSEVAHARKAAWLATVMKNHSNSFFFPETNPRRSQSQFGFGVLLSDEAGNPTLHRVPHRNGSVRTPAPPEEVLFFFLNPPPWGSGLHPPPFIVLDGGVVACQYLFLYSTEEMRVLRHANPQQRARTMHGLEYRVLPGGDGGRAGPHCPEGRVV